MLSFRLFAKANAVLALTLFAILLAAPEWIIRLFGMEQAIAASVLGRRAAMLFLGYGVLSLTASSSPHNQARQAILLSISTAMLGLACMGLAEYLYGRATWPILLAMSAEILFSIWGFTIYKAHRSQPKETT